MTDIRLLGRSWQPEELRRYLGDLSQIADIRRGVLDEGPGNGVSTVDVRTGGGLSFTLLPSRGLDISFAEYQGYPLCWRSPIPETAPGLTDPRGLEWLRSFSGGLVTTCGLMSAGQPSDDDGEHWGLHGRASSLAADHVGTDAGWEGERTYALRVQGRVREGRALGAVLERHRTIETELGSRRIRITDVVRNVGHLAADHMYRYHINAGYPILSSSSHCASDITGISRRADDEPRHGERWDNLHEPREGVGEQVFYLDIRPDEDGWAQFSLVNPDRGDGRQLGLQISYRADTLPEFLFWHHLVAGAYVVGLEPSTCRDEGRAAERARGALLRLEPEKSVEYVMEIEVIDEPTPSDHRSPTSQSFRPEGGAL